MVAILAERLKLPNEVATESLAFSAERFRGRRQVRPRRLPQLLKLRAEMLGTWGGTPPAPDKYLDFTYYQRALASM